MGELIDLKQWSLGYTVLQVAVMLKGLPPEIKEKEPYVTMLKERVYGTMIKWGIDCMYVRNPLGFYCGYARIKQGHPLNKATQDDIEEIFSVHGGITFCHRVGSDLVIGFDCGHHLDYVPYLELATKDLCTLKLFANSQSGTYRTEEYVREQLTELARQIKEKEHENALR